MNWRRQSTSSHVEFEVELSEFSEPQLLQRLIDAGWLSGDEAAAIQKRAKSNDSYALPFSTFDPDHLHDAHRAIMRNNRSEALHHLERFLGRDWLGRLQ